MLKHYDVMVIDGPFGDPDSPIDHWVIESSNPVPDARQQVRDKGYVNKVWAVWEHYPEGWETTLLHHISGTGPAPTFIPFRYCEDETGFQIGSFSIQSGEREPLHHDDMVKP